MTPVTYQQTVEGSKHITVKQYKTSAYREAHPLEQVWYDPKNPSHFKTLKKFKELGVDPEWALENGWDWTSVGGMTTPRDQARQGTAGNQVGFISLELKFCFQLRFFCVQKGTLACCESLKKPQLI